MGKLLTGLILEIVALGLIFVLSVIGAYPTKWIINYLIAPSALLAVFGVAKLTFWKALALNYITAALFKATAINTESK